MIYKQETVHALYRKLLALYPRAFRERLGESIVDQYPCWIGIPNCD
jgi:hypothetical protein